MLANEPFFLAQKYSKVFLSYCFEAERVEPNAMLDASVLIAKLRKVVDDF